MPRSLSESQIQHYDQTGLLAPVPVLSPDELLSLRGHYEQLAFHLDGIHTPMDAPHPHLYFPWAYELVCHPKVLDTVEDVIGPDVAVLGMTLFCKPPYSSGHVAWHQDGYRWGTETTKAVSVWLALTESTVENGCMHVQLGTHRQKHSHTLSTSQSNMLYGGLEVEEPIDPDHMTPVELAPGEISLHHYMLMHGSFANTSASPRLGIAIRYIAPPTWTSTDILQPLVLARGTQLGKLDLRWLKSPPQGSFETNFPQFLKFVQDHQRGHQHFPHHLHGSVEDHANSRCSMR